MAVNRTDHDLMVMACLERITGTINGRQVRIIVSQDGGANWADPVVVSTDKGDKSSLEFAMDGPNLVATFHGDAGEGSGTYALVSSNRGRSWSAAQRVSEQKVEEGQLAVHGQDVIFVVNDGQGAKVRAARIKDK